MLERARSSSQRDYPQHPVASAHALVFRGDEVLLIRRKHEPSQGLWSIPGGVIRIGETASEAAQREVCEECGIEIVIHDVFDVADNIIRDPTGQIRFHYVLTFFLAGHAGGTVSPGSDASEALWVTHGEIGVLEMSPLAREVVERAFLAVSRTSDEAGESCS